MSSISFFAPVTYGPLANSSGKKVLEAVDDYFFLNGRRAQVLKPSNLRDSEPVGYRYDDQPFYITALKVVSYFTIIIPAIALIAKAILRSTYEFKLTTGPGYKYICHLPQSNPADVSHNNPSVPPGANDKEFPFLSCDVAKILTNEEMIKLKLRQPLGSVSPHNYQPSQNPEKYFSELEYYNDSYFDVIENLNPDTNKAIYEVTRKKMKDDDVAPFVPLHRPIPLTPELLENLGIEFYTINFSPNCVEGKSNLPHYKGSLFRWLDSGSPGFELGWLIRY